MQKIRLIRKGIFPLRKLNIVINGKAYLLSGNQELQLDNLEKDLDIQLKIDWWHSHHKFSLDKQAPEVVIKFCLPDVYFFIGMFVVMSLSILAILNYIPIITTVISVMAFVFLQAYYLFVNPTKYFNVTLK